MQEKVAVKDQIEYTQIKRLVKYNLIIQISKSLTLNNKGSIYYNKEII